MSNTDSRIIYEGEGSPEGVVTAPIGSMYIDKGDNDTPVAIYYKLSGEGSEGWVNILKVDIDVVAENLAELLTNTVNMSSLFYDIFLDQNPKYVELKMFDDNNRLITHIIPNRAQDRENATLSGNGSPDGVVAAPIGTVYIDKLTSTIYYKVSGEAEDPNGWTPTISQSDLNQFIGSYLINNNYIKRGALNTILSESIREGEVKLSETSSLDIKANYKEGESTKFGVVKLDDETIKWTNEDSQISAVAIKDDNTSEAKKIWIGKGVAPQGEPSYSNLTVVDPNTIYILTDLGQILVGNTQVASNVFPSSTSETLTLGNSGDSYTAPTNGWFLLTKVAGIANAKLEMQNTTTQYTSTMYLPNTDSVGTVMCPALQGEEVTVTYTASGATQSFIFINAAANRV